MTEHTAAKNIKWNKSKQEFIKEYKSVRKKIEIYLPKINQKKKEE